MIFPKSLVLSSSFFFIILSFFPSHSIGFKIKNETNTRIQSNPQDSFTSRSIDSSSRQFNNGENHFAASNWKVWDHPVDQLAIESNKIQSGKGLRKSKNIAKDYIGSSTNTGTERQGCNNGVQVSIYPVILAFIAAVAGLITLAIIWFFTKKWAVVDSSGNSQYGSGGGWSNQRNYDLAGFSRTLKNIDFDQLTNLVTKGVESYRKMFETPSTT